MVRSTDRLAMTIAVDLGRKATNKTKQLYTKICPSYGSYIFDGIHI